MPGAKRGEARRAQDLPPTVLVTTQCRKRKRTAKYSDTGVEQSTPAMCAGTNNAKTVTPGPAPPHTAGALHPTAAVQTPGGLTPQQQAFLAAFSFPAALLRASIMSSATSRAAGAPGAESAAATSSSSSLPAATLVHPAQDGTVLAASSSRRVDITMADRAPSYESLAPHQPNGRSSKRVHGGDGAACTVALIAPVSTRPKHAKAQAREAQQECTVEHEALPFTATGTTSGGNSGGAAAGAGGGGGGGPRRPRKQARPVSCS